MKLFYSPGACSLASRIVLNEIGAEADFERVDLYAKQTETGRDFRTVNPLGYVPALELEDGSVLLENGAILPYIASLKPNSLAPGGDPLVAARLHEALAFLSSELHKAFGPFFGKPEGAAREAALARLEPRLDFAEQRLNTQDYWLGTDFSLADAYAFVILSWSRPLGISLDRYPAIRAYLERIGRREAVQRALADEGLLETA